MRKSKRKMFDTTEKVLNKLWALPEDACPVTCAALALSFAYHEAMPEGGEQLELAVHKFLQAKGRLKLIEQFRQYAAEPVLPPWQQPSAATA